jgi:predicted phosphodiesterase
MKLSIQSLKEKNGKDYASVVFLGDIHWGSPECDRERVVRQVDYCLNNDTYVFLMGDLIENSTRNSVGAGVYEQTINPETQTEEMVALLKPLSNKGLILGSLQGNHEDRTYKDSGFDPGKMIARQLKVPYLGAAGWNLWRVGNQSYQVYTIHGASGSQHIHTKLNVMRTISNNFNADVIAHGHFHECVSASILIQDIDKRNKKIIERKKHLIGTGHYLKYEGYAQQKGMSIGKMGSPKVKFYGNKSDIHVSY